MIREDRLVDLFLNLIKINSPSFHEKEVVAWTKRYLTDVVGLEVTEDDAGEKVGSNANNLIAWLPGNVPGAPRIFLSAHFDTVEPTPDLAIDEVDGVFVSTSDTILGADDKGGMAPAIEAVHALKESGVPHGDVCLLLSICEETGLLGAGAVKIEDLHLDFGYVLDTGPPVGTYVTRTATHDKLDVTILGKPAHAGKDPENGVNAIMVAADALSGMKMGRIGPETTANVGIIEGGTGVNVVCPKVTLRAEARSTSVEELDAQVDHMIERFVEAGERWGAQIQIDHARHYHAYHVSPDAKVVQVALAASKALGLPPELRTTLGGSDANIYNARGLPCIVVATGMEKIHTHDERISRAALIETAKLAFQLVIEAAK